MTNEFVLEAINREFPDAVIASSEPFGFLTIEVKKEELKKIIHHLKESSLRFIFLTDICGIHYPEDKEKELGIIYHLHNLEDNIRIRIKSFFSRENAEVDTITDLYSVIVNSEDLGYHPLLKEYALEDGTRTDKDDTMFGR